MGLVVPRDRIFNELESESPYLITRLNSLISHYLPAPTYEQVHELISDIFQRVYSPTDSGIGEVLRARAADFAPHVTELLLDESFGDFKLERRTGENKAAMRAFAEAICELFPKASLRVPQYWEETRAMFVPIDSQEDMLHYERMKLSWEKIKKQSPLLQARLYIIPSKSERDVRGAVVRGAVAG